MKIKLDASVFAPAAAWAAGYAMEPHRDIAPHLTGVLATFDGETLALSATDFETWGRVEVPATGEPGQVLLPGGLLGQIAKTLPDAVVIIDATGPVLALSCGSQDFALPTSPAEDTSAWPAMPPALGTVAAGELALGVRQVAAAVSRSAKSEPYLRAIRLEAQAGDVWLAATNLYVVAGRTLTLRPAGDIQAGVLIPATALEGIAGQATGEVTLYAGERLAGFSWPGHTVLSVVVEVQTLPAYRKFLERAPTVHVAVRIKPLVAALKHVRLVAQRDFPKVTMTFSPGQVVLEAGTAPTRAAETVDVEYDGRPFTVVFKVPLLLDALGALEGTTARIGFADDSGECRPVTFTSGDVESDHRHVVQPVRV